jgi:acyl-CoA thioesterase-1
MSHASAVKISVALRRVLSLLPVFALLAIATGCEGGGDGGGSDIDHDFGARDPSQCAAVGDSITVGLGAEGAPWPARLEGKLGRPVANYGVPGVGMNEASGLLAKALATEAGYILVALGSNDVLTERSSLAVQGNLSAMIAAIRAADAIPVVGNITPMAGPKESYNASIKDLNAGIKQVCSAEGVLLVNLNGSVSKNMLQADGIHPNSEGQEAIAKAFYGKLKGRVQ